MAYVRIDDPNSNFHGCVFKVAERRTCYDGRPEYVLEGCEGSGLRFSNYEARCVDVTDEEVATIDLKDQPCYKNAADYFQIGQHIRIQYHGDMVHARVSDFCTGWYEYGGSSCMLIARFKRYGYTDTRTVRFDKVELVEDNPADYPNDDGKLPIAFDYLTFEPIYEDSDYRELYLGTRRHEDSIGFVLEDNIGEGWEICEDCCRAVLYYENDENIVVCSSCYDDGYSRCDDCGCITPSSELIEGDNGYYCSCCIDEHPIEENCTDFHDYYYTPSTLYFRDYVDGEEVFVPDYNLSEYKAFMGVELEIDGGRSRAECVNDLMDAYGGDALFYCKYDGSLGDRGIEIVTHPCTLQYHLHAYPWQRITEIAKECGFRSHDTTTCGMHVHVSRNALGDNSSERDLTVAKMMLLMDKFWKKLVVFSRRDLDHLQQWAKKPNANITRGDTDRRAISKAKKACEGGHMQRYHALNITNTETVEFRLFRGTLNPDTIKANLQLVANIVGLAMSRDLLGVQDATWEDVVKFQEYPELNNYVAKKHLDDYNDDPLGEIIVEDKINFEAGDTVICNRDPENPFPGEIVETIRDDVHVVRNDAADDDYRIVFSDELQLA